MGERFLLSIGFAGYLTMCGAVNAAQSLPSRDCGWASDKRIYPIAATTLLAGAAAFASMYRLTREVRIE